MAAFGKLDIIVYNAGTSATGPFEKLTDEAMDTDLDLKLFAAPPPLPPGMAADERAQMVMIINILNVGASAARELAPTSVSRAAGMAFTKVLSGEGAPHNVLVNALLVGLIEADQHVQAAKKRHPACRSHRRNGEGRSHGPHRARRRIRQRRASSRPTPDPMSPARQSTSTAAALRWFERRAAATPGQDVCVKPGAAFRGDKDQRAGALALSFAVPVSAPTALPLRLPLFAFFFFFFAADTSVRVTPVVESLHGGWELANAFGPSCASATAHPIATNVAPRRIFFIVVFPVD